MSKKEKQVKVSFTYDRLWEQKLSQAYHLLVPSNQPVVLTAQTSTELITEIAVYENSSDLYESILRSTEGK